MSKLPAITPKKLIKILEKLGFKLDHSTGSHFIFYNPKTKKNEQLFLTISRTYQKEL
jgi:predicted RNA binding protein YcfA (HicA-like mRNA interferase family)